MRKLIRIVEARGQNYRLWIARDGRVVELDQDTSHAQYVVLHPKEFGIDQGHIDELQAYWEGRDEEFDYDYIIALGEQGGWVRVSGDGAVELDRVVGKAITTRYAFLDPDDLDRIIRAGRLPVPTSSNTRSVALP